ncbi:hypothetical protein D9M68_760060 [compost metagenome]
MISTSVTDKPMPGSGIVAGTGSAALAANAVRLKKGRAVSKLIFFMGYRWRGMIIYGHIAHQRYMILIHFKEVYGNTYKKQHEDEQRQDEVKLIAGQVFNLLEHNY